MIALIFGALSFLYSRIRSAAPEDPGNLLSDFMANFSEERWAEAERHLAIRRLKKLLLNEKIEQFRKIHRLKHGFLKNAASFASFIDIRPYFQGDNSEVHGFVPMIQFRITTDSENTIDKDFVFQMDSNGLEALKEALKSIDKKIEILKNSNSLIAPIYFDKK